MSLISNSNNHPITDQQTVITSEEQLTNELEHIFLYLSNFKAMKEENSDDGEEVVDQSNLDGEEIESDDEEDEYEEFQSCVVEQMSEIFERRRNDSSFVLVYNNVHYLKEPVIFGTILDFYFKPSESDYDPKKVGGSSESFLHFLTLRQVCRSWKKFIDEKYGRQFILSIFQDRVKFRDCKPNTDLYLFRLCGLPLTLACIPALLALELCPNHGGAVGISFWISYRLTCMIVSGCPMLVPAFWCGALVDLAIGQMRKRRFFHRLGERYENMERDIMSEVVYFEKCEIISTVQDLEKYNGHSCYYIIEVTLNVNGKLLGYQIQKKYTQFKALFDIMCKCVECKDGLLVVEEEKIEFPAKRWSIFTNSQEIIEERRHTFQKMLNCLVSHQDVFHNSDIYTFFYDRKNQQALLGNTATETGEEEGFLLVDNE